MKITLLLVLIAIISYSLANVNGAIVSSGLFFKKDIRKMGSGNAGLANFYRNFGLRGAAVVIAIDFLKGFIGVMLGGFILGLASDNESYVVVGKAFATFCAVLGHIYPALYGFKGGKGIMTGFAAAMAIDWRIGMICMLVFLGCVVGTRYVSLGSIMATVMLPILMLAFDYNGIAFWLVFVSCALVVWKHRENIMRIIRKEEPKFVIKSNLEKKLDD